MNEDCQKIIESLPGDPLLADIVPLYSKVGTVVYTMAALAAVLWPSQKCFTCGEPGHLKAQCPRNYEQKVKPKINPGNKLYCSFGIDIPITDTVTVLTKQICKIPLSAYGPIGQGLSALLIGRSSSNIQGINVHLGVIDSDYLGQLYAMELVGEPSVVIQKGTCLAQLIPFVSCVPNVVDWSHDTGGFGSTGAPQIVMGQFTGIF
ncbi:LOW QUALITY PROTEIN: hypothetical protein Nmel_003453 [Mimus melanotis]